MILDGELYFASMQELNDPFEFRWRDRFPADPDEIDAFAKEVCAQRFPLDRTPAERLAHYEPLRQSMHEIVARRHDRTALTETSATYGVFCASEINSDILMWSHYAADHKGLCVGICTERVTDKQFYAVQYTDSLPIIDVREYLQFSTATFDKMALAKAKHWEYEKEWRNGDVPGAHRFPGCVDAIVLGAMMPEATRREVREATESAKCEIKIVEAGRSESHYRLDIPRLD